MIAREMDSLMDTVNNHVQRAINHAIVEHVLPQIQGFLRTFRDVNRQHGNSPFKDKPQLSSENASNTNKSQSSRRNLPNSPGSVSEQDADHHMVTGDNESPNPVPEFLTGCNPQRISPILTITNR